MTKPKDTTQIKKTFYQEIATAIAKAHDGGVTVADLNPTSEAEIHFTHRSACQKAEETGGAVCSPVRVEVTAEGRFIVGPRLASWQGRRTLTNRAKQCSAVNCVFASRRHCSE
jgi:hypothetical protein